MEDQKFTKNPIEHINASLRGYVEYFLNLYTMFKWEETGNVRDNFRNGEKIETVEEYFKKFRKTKEAFSKEELKDPIFIEKVKALNKLTQRLNSLGKKIDEQAIKHAVDEAKEIVYS